ncbi:MAG: hypothetical protein M4D80_38940 [Myxococcota bacterium]|nr:hypothetical protein [Myxococcota bacterium]
MRSLLLASALLAAPLTASAHIHLTAPQARTDSSTGDQKDGPCGVLGQVRTNRVTALKPGEQIMVTWTEPIQHPGYFRIALQPNGDAFPIPAEVGVGGFPTEDRTGMTDGPTGAIIIKDRIPDGMLMTQITLPNMECTNCTLQFIQVMTDAPPYTTDAASNDIYFNCADVTLANAAPMVDAGVNTGPDAPGGMNMNPGTTGGCSTGGGAGLLVGFALLGLVTKRRRA